MAQTKAHKQFIRWQDSELAAMVTLGVLIDREFYAECRRLRLDARIAITSPLAYILTAEANKAWRQ